MGRPLWAKHVLSRAFVLALIFFVASSGILFMGDSFAKYYTANHGEDSAEVSAFIIESDVTEDESLSRSLTMSCDLANLDTKGTPETADDEYFIHWPITVTNTNAGGEISNVKMRYDIIVDLPDDARDYLFVTMGNMNPYSVVTETRTFLFENAGQLAPGVTETDRFNVTFRIPRHRMDLTEDLVNGVYEWGGGVFTLDGITLTVHAEQIQGDSHGGESVPTQTPWGFDEATALTFANTYKQWNYQVDSVYPFYQTSELYNGATVIGAQLNKSTHIGSATDEGYFLNYYVPGLVAGNTYTFKIAYKANITGGRLRLHDDFNFNAVEQSSFLIPYTSLQNSAEWKELTFTATVQEYNLKFGLYALRFSCNNNIGETLNGTVNFAFVSVTQI